MKSQAVAHNIKLQPIFFFFFHCDCNFYYDNNLWLCSGCLLGRGLWGIGKQSSPRQAFNAAGFPVVADRVGHDQNDGVGQQLSTTLNPPNTLFILPLQSVCDLSEMESNW